MTPQETEQDLLASAGGVSCGSLDQQWPTVEMGTLAAEVLGGAPLHVSPLGGHREPHHRVYRLQGWVASGQTTNREGAQPHPSANN